MTEIAKNNTDVVPLAEPAVYFPDELREFVGNRRVRPGLAVLRAEKQMVLWPDIGDNTERRHRLRGQGAVSVNERLGALVVPNAGPFEIHLGTWQFPAVGCTVSVAGGQDQHGAELGIGSFQEQVQDGRRDQAVTLADGSAGDAFEALTEAHGLINPLAGIVGIIEAGRDALPVLVEVMAGEAVGGHLAGQGGEVLSAKRFDGATWANRLSEVDQSVVNVFIPVASDPAGVGVGLADGQVAVDQIPHSERGVVSSSQTGYATRVEVILDPVVFGDSISAVAVGPEVMHSAVDAFLEAPVLPGLGGETLDGIDLWSFSSRHDGHDNGTVSVQNSSQSENVTVSTNAVNRPHARDLGSIAQRLEQGSHKTSREPRNPRGGAENAVFDAALAAEKGPKGTNCSLLTTRVRAKWRGPKIQDDPPYSVSKKSGCWNWNRSLNRDGYGYFQSNHKIIAAHRFYYEQARGPIPSGLVIDHLCRNRKCVNPDHLEVVTSRTNIRRGAVCKKLNIALAMEIRTLVNGGQRRIDVARRFGISKGMVTHIMQGKEWSERDDAKPHRKGAAA